MLISISCKTFSAHNYDAHGHNIFNLWSHRLDDYHFRSLPLCIIICSAFGPFFQIFALTKPKLCFDDFDQQQKNRWVATTLAMGRRFRWPTKDRQIIFTFFTLEAFPTFSPIFPFRSLRTTQPRLFVHN